MSSYCKQEVIMRIRSYSLVRSLPERKEEKWGTYDIIDRVEQWSSISDEIISQFSTYYCYDKKVITKQFML